MDEDLFNMNIRKYLKKVGVTSQREIESAVRDAVADGRLKGNETLDVRVTLAVGDLDLAVEIEGRIALAE